MRNRRAENQSLSRILFCFVIDIYTIVLHSVQLLLLIIIITIISSSSSSIIIIIIIIVIVTVNIIIIITSLCGCY